MSQDFHQGVYNFSNGYERSPNMKQQQGGDWISQRDMLKVQGFELQQQVQVEVSGGPQVYDAGGMLTEVIDSFPRGRKVVNNHILEGQIHQSSYRWSQKQPLAVAVNEPVLPLMNPHIIKASSSSPTCSTSVLPNSLASHQQHLHHQGYQVEVPASQFSWIRGGAASEVDDPTGPKIGRNLEGQGLSLSLSSSLPNLEAAKFQELKIGGDGGMCFYDIQGVGVGPSMNFYGFKNHQETNHQHPMGFSTTDYQIHVGHPASSRIGNVLRNSRYLRAAQELLEEFCCVGRGQFKSQNGNPRSISSGDGGGPVASSSSTDRPPLSAAEKHEYQRKKVKLLAMLDEVDARYTHYCEQMQAIVSSFDSVLGYGAAAPYTILAQKAMSRHFRSIKDAILAQVKATCEVLGDKEVAGSICLTKGETPRLKLLDQKFRQQKALHQLGMLDPDTWRPQRGLPERSVNILRAWLFEHFLHPYPSDADKHLLSRQTTLSKNQVSNWFINARVRLWKPMVEEIYKEEAKDEGQDQQTTANHAAHELAKSEDDDSEDHQSQTQTHAHGQSQNQKIVSAQPPMHHSKITTAPKVTTISSSTATLGEGLGRSEINAAEKDPSKNIINYGQYTLGNQAILQGTPTTSTPSIISPTAAGHHHHHDNDDDDQTIMPTYGCFMGISPDAGGMYGGRASLPEFGTQLAAGDVSLTLGLRHSTNVPRKSTTEFSIRDFGAY